MLIKVFDKLLYNPSGRLALLSNFHVMWLNMSRSLRWKKLFHVTFIWIHVKKKKKFPNFSCFNHQLILDILKFGAIQGIAETFYSCVLPPDSLTDSLTHRLTLLVWSKMRHLSRHPAESPWQSAVLGGFMSSSSCSARMQTGWNHQSALCGCSKWKKRKREGLLLVFAFITSKVTTLRSFRPFILKRIIRKPKTRHIFDFHFVNQATESRSKINILYFIWLFTLWTVHILYLEMRARTYPALNYL